MMANTSAANPLPSASRLDLSYQSQFGWRIPSSDELLLAPYATDFLFNGANVPLYGTDPASGARFAVTSAALNEDGAVAIPYFSSVYRWADWGNGLGQGGVWSGMSGEQWWSEQLIIRNVEDVLSPAPVPEPSTFILLGAGLAGLAAMGIRRKMN